MKLQWSLNNSSRHAWLDAVPYGGCFAFIDYYGNSWRFAIRKLVEDNGPTLDDICPLQQFTDPNNPPKDYVEALVRLRHPEIKE
jgi:hypothetical protein